MLELIPNEKKSAIQLIFTNFFTDKREFITAFDLEDAKSIGLDLIKMVKEIHKEKGKQDE